MVFKNSIVVDYFRNGNFSADQIRYWYSILLDDVKMILKSGMPAKFLRADEIKGIEPHLSIDDKFLSLGLSNLGKDLDSRGSYFPFVAKADDRLRIHEGIQRHASLLDVKSRRYFFTLIHSEDNMNKTIPEIEFYMLYPTEHIKILLRDMNPFVDINKCEKDLYIVTCNRLQDMYIILVFFGMYVGRALYPYRNDIHPSILLNDVNEFNKWRFSK